MRVSQYLFGLTLTLSLVLISCSATEKMDTAALRQAIEAENAKFVAAFNSQDAAGVAALYTENARILPPNSEMIQGRQNIEKALAAEFQMGFKDLSLTTTEVEGNGDTAYEIGKYSGTLQPEGQEGITVSGKYVVIWKRQADGRWQLDTDIWNGSKPMSGQ